MALAAVAPRIPAAGIVGEVALREAAASELGQVMSLVRAALAAKLGLGENGYVAIDAFYADRVIASREGRYYAWPYTIDADNRVSLGEPAEVVEQYVPVRVAEASIQFLESLDPEGRSWEAVLIRAGLSGNGNYYPDTALAEAAPLFEGARVLARSDNEHLRGEGKDVRNIVGWISGARFVEGAAPDRGRLTGTLNFAAGAAALRDTIADAWKRGKRDLVGLSIDAFARSTRRMVESKSVRYATGFTKVNSVDLIVEPGAGGALVRLLEAAADTPREEHDPMKERMLATIKARAPAVFAAIDPATITDEQLETRYAEALALTHPAPAAGGVSPAELAEQVRMVEARAYARTAIGASTLPAPAQERLQGEFARRASFTPADVDEAIKTERTYVARFTESGKVRLDGEGNLIQLEERPARIAGMLDAFFDPAHKDHRQVQSFRECYIEITGDRRVTGQLANMDRSRLAESIGRVAESLDSSSFAYVLGDAITRRLIADYRTPSQYDVWRPLVNVVPVADFRTQHRTRFGGYGNLPTVAEGDPYTALSSPSDEEATYAVAKRGGTEDLTIEAVRNDDVGAIRRIPIALSRAAKRTVGQFVLDFVRTNPTLYDSVAFFHATHGNLGANALDATYLAAARLRMLKQTEAGSSARLGIPPRFLVVPVDLEGTAVGLFNRDTNLDKTFIQAQQLTVVPVWYWTDTNDWAIAADPLDCPSIEVAFLDGNEEPELFVQDNPTVGSVFSNDKLTWKIRHIYGGQVVNYRGWDKSVVA